MNNKQRTIHNIHLRNLPFNSNLNHKLVISVRRKLINNKAKNLLEF